MHNSTAPAHLWSLRLVNTNTAIGQRQAAPVASSCSPLSLTSVSFAQFPNAFPQHRAKMLGSDSLACGDLNTPQILQAQCGGCLPSPVGLMCWGWQGFRGVVSLTGLLGFLFYLCLRRTGSYHRSHSVAVQTLIHCPQG